MSDFTEISDKVIKSEIKKAAQKAICENIALGITTTVLIDGNIVEIAPDKTVKVVKVLNLKPLKRTTKRRFTLG